MQKRLILSFVLFLLVSTAAYSVVNTAESILPDRAAERAACAALTAAFCSTHGQAVCSAVVPQECGTMQPLPETNGRMHTHSIFYALAMLLFGIVLVELLRRRSALASFAGTFLQTAFFPNSNSPPLLVGGLSSLRF